MSVRKPVPLSLGVTWLCLVLVGTTVMGEDSHQATLPAHAASYHIVDSVSLPCRDADGIALGDISGNGKLDILASEGKQGVTLWFEQGDNWKEWTRHVIHSMSATPSEIEGNALGDFNGDGQFEAISLNQPRGEIYLHRHGGDPRGRWETIVIQADRPLLQDAMVTDVDGDGRLDLVYTWEGRAAGDGGVHWLKLVGDDPLAPSQWRDHVLTQHESAWWLAPRRVDLNGNGRETEFIYTARHLRSRNPGSRPGLYWLEPPDDVTQPWTSHSIDATLPHPLHVDLGNLSGDGRNLDLVVGGFDTETIYWYEFGEDWRRHELKVPRIAGIQPNNVWNVKCVPLGGDRDQILAPVIRGRQGALLLYEFSEGEFRAGVLRELNYGHPMDDRILLHDVTGDGQPEAFIPDSGPGVNLLHIFRFGRKRP